MSDNLKLQPNLFHYVLAVIILIVSGLVFISYGWISYATFTERPGMNGSMYYYYRADRIVFALYELLVALAALVTIMRILFFMYYKSRSKLIKTFIHFLIFLAILIGIEIYLSTRFVPKG
jgi:hypothetical protein